MCRAMVRTMKWSLCGPNGVDRRSSAPAKLEGFGSKLVHRSMAAQLGGTIAFDWSAEGLVPPCE